MPSIRDETLEKDDLLFVMFSTCGGSCLAGFCLCTWTFVFGYTLALFIAMGFYAEGTIVLFNFTSLDFYSIDNETIVREAELNYVLNLAIFSWLILAVFLAFYCCFRCFSVCVEGSEDADCGDRWDDLKSRLLVFTGEHESLIESFNLLSILVFGIIALVVGFGSYVPDFITALGIEEDLYKPGNELSTNVFGYSMIGLITFVCCLPCLYCWFVLFLISIVASHDDTPS